MPMQLMSDAEALRLFFTEDIYLITSEVNAEEAILAQPSPNILPEVIEKAAVIATVAAETQVERFDYMGGNGKKVLVVMNDPIHPEGKPGEIAFLWRILGAINLGVKDCAVLNRCPYPKADFDALTQFFNPRVLLSFGIDPVNLALEAEENSDLILHNGVQIICSPALDLLDSNKALKTLLWKSLQQLDLS